MKLNELLDPVLLARRITEKYVKVQQHPTKPFEVLNYTDQCLWDRQWDDVTRTCRGLIVDSRTYEIVARGPSKFFNAFEPGADEIATDEPVVVTDKIDGSLGLLMWADDRWEFATRGSFASEQAAKATEIWHDKYDGVVTPPDGLSFFFEIVFPTNRIVVDYGDMEDLVLLGAVDLDTGFTVTAERACELLAWPGPVTKTFPYTSLASALAAEPRDNSEGFVIHAPRTNARLKTKSSEYVRLHRLLTGLTARRLWEYLAVKAVEPTAILGKRERTAVDYMVRRLHMAPERIQEVLDGPEDWQEALVDRVPEEFEQWVRSRVGEIAAAVEGSRAELHSAYSDIRGRFEVPPTTGKERGEFVKLAQAQYAQEWQLMMALLDGMPVEASLWERHRPEAERAFAQQSEDVA